MPAWYSDLDLVLGDTNAGLEDVVSESAETSYGQDVLENENSNQSTDEELDEEVLNDNSELTQSQESIIRKQIVVKPHQKRKAIRSQTQALSHLAGGMTQMIESQAKRHKALPELERERDRNFMEFKQVEAEKNRQHELQIAQNVRISNAQSRFSKGTLFHKHQRLPNDCASRKKKGAEFLSKSLLLLHHVLNILTNKCLL